MNDAKTFEVCARMMISEWRATERKIQGRMAQEFFRAMLGLHLSLEQSSTAWQEIVRRWEEAESHLPSGGHFRQIVLSYFLESGHLSDPIVTEFHEFQRLRLSSTTDHLTGLNNRRFFDSMLTQEVHRATRYGDDLSLVLIDLNRFKEVNDTHGHDFGDQLLILIGRILKSVLRITDSAYRVGGDEFALLLPQTPQAGALSLAERLRQRFADETGLLEGLRVPVSLAYGVANCPREATEAKALFAFADQRLYDFKRSIGSPRCAPRRFKRIPTEDLDAYVVLRLDHAVYQARLIDFSFGGIGLQIDADVELPDQMVGDLHLPVFPAASVTLRKVYVLRHGDALRIGCAFAQPLPPSAATSHEATPTTLHLP